jgi:DNA topoisomerase-1
MHSQYSIYTFLLTLMKSQTLRQEATSLPPRTLKRKKPVVYAESSSEDDTPLASSPMKTNGQEATSLPPRTLKRKKPVYAESSSEDDTPLASSPMKPNGKSIVKQESSSTDAQVDEDVPNKRRISNGKPPRKKIKDEDDDDDDQPIMPAKSSASRKQKARTKSKPDSEAEVPLPKTSRRKRVKEEKSNSPEREVPKKRKRSTKGKTEETEGSSPTKAKRKKKEEEEEEEEVFKWWENEADPNGDDGTVKWQTLGHNGVIFPPPYEPLPGNVKMKYKGMFLLWAFLSPYIYRPVGEPVDLSFEAEEVAGFYAALLESDHAKDTTFNNNFFDDWKTVMKKHPPVRCVVLQFNMIFNFF